MIHFCLKFTFLWGILYVCLLDLTSLDRYEQVSATAVTVKSQKVEGTKDKTEKEGKMDNLREKQKAFTHGKLI